MKASDEENNKVKALRRLERQAKQLIYKMKRLETEWKKLRSEFKSTSASLPATLGDVLSKWNRS